MAKRRIYSADVRVVATVYVIAKNEKEARRKIREKLLDGIEAGESDDISGASYESPDLPEISYSPAMTPDEKQRIRVHFVEENDPEGDDEPCPMAGMPDTLPETCPRCGADKHAGCGEV